MRTSDTQATTSTITAPSSDAQHAFEIVPRIMRHDLEALSARRAGKAPVPPDPLDIGLWSPMRQQLALALQQDGALDPEEMDDVAIRVLAAPLLRRLACWRLCWRRYADFGASVDVGDRRARVHCRVRLLPVAIFRYAAARAIHCGSGSAHGT